MEQLVHDADLRVVSEVYPSLVPVDDYAGSLTIPSAPKVKDAISGLDLVRASGPYGFNCVFYLFCWNCIGLNVVNAVQFFLGTGFLQSRLNFNFLILLLKSLDVDSIDKFRVIVMGNLLFKVVMKILADRSALIASRAISINQFGFIRGHQIQDCIVLALDCVNLMQKHCFGSNLAAKVDIQKAFDTIRWPFLLKVLQTFVSDSRFCSWIGFIFQSTRILVLFHCSQRGYFGCLRGVSQRYPLSSLLFGLDEDFLSHYFTSLVSSGALLPMVSL